MDLAGDEAGAWSVTAAGRAAEAAAPARLTVSGEVVIVLLLVQQNGPERLYAYVTVAYETVG